MRARTFQQKHKKGTGRLLQFSAKPEEERTKVVGKPLNTMKGRKREDLPLGWITLTTAKGEKMYENLITGKRQSTKPHTFGADVKKRAAEKFLWPRNLPEHLKNQLLSLSKKQSERAKFANKYFGKLVHVMHRKYQGGMNASRLNGFNLARDAIAAANNGTGRYASLQFSTTPDNNDLPLRLRKQIQQQQIKLSTVLKKQKKAVEARINAVLRAYQSASSHEEKKAEIDSLLSTHEEIEQKHKKSGEKDSDLPTFERELKREITERSGLVGEITQEFLEIELFAKLSKNSRQCLSMSGVRQNEFKNLLSAVVQVANTRSVLLKHKSHTEDLVEEDDEEALVQHQIEFSKLQMAVAQAQKKLKMEKDAKTSLIRKMQNVHSSVNGNEDMFTASNESREQPVVRSPKRGKIPYTMSSTFSLARKHRKNQKRLQIEDNERDQQNFKNKIQALETYAGISNSKGRIFERHQKVEAVRIEQGKKAHYSGVVLEQSTEDGSCTIFFVEDGTICRGIPSTDIRSTNEP